MEARQESVRASEIIASLCLATDLGMGFPFEHGLEGTLTSLRLCEVLGVDQETVSQTYYASLLMYAGCTVDARERSHLFGGSMTQNHTHRQFGSSMESFLGVAASLPDPDASWPHRVGMTAARLPRAGMFVKTHFVALCEVAGMLAERVGVHQEVYEMFPLLTERWDGKGILRRAQGEGIPLPVRIIQVARDAAFQRLTRDDATVKDVIRDRSGKAFDPDVVEAFLGEAEEVLGPRDASETVWQDVLDGEPKPHLVLEGKDIDRAIVAIGLFSDMVSPFFTGHSSGVAELAADAARLEGLPEDEVRRIRWAGHLHEIGRTAISTSVWEKPGKLSADEREQVRLHPYHTDRVLTRSQFLRALAPMASAHHERLDGSGYYRGLEAPSLSPGARLLAAASAYRSKTEPRSYREAMTAEEAARAVVERAEDGFLDPTMTMAVVEAAGMERPVIGNPLGLTDREIEVVGHLARGLQTKQIARVLDISPKTVDRHIQNSYRKMNVSSRAAATLVATETGLVSR